MCERSKLRNFSQYFCSFSQTRHLTVELSRAKPKLDSKTLKMTRQFCRKNSWKIETFKNNFVGRKNNEDATLTPNVLLTNVGLSPKRWHMFKGHPLGSNLERRFTQEQPDPCILWAHEKSKRRENGSSTLHFQLFQKFTFFYLDYQLSVFKCCWSLLL